VASQESTAITTRAPFVDVVFGQQTLHRLHGMIDEFRESEIAVVDVSFPKIEKFDYLPTPNVGGPSVYITVMEGCNKYCSFCVVPHTRGHEVSRPMDDVLREVADVAGQGVREINFLGQNVNAYHGPINGGVADLSELIREAARVEGIDRIRFTTSHPVEFTDNLVEAYRDVPELVSHLHLPVQSGSDRDEDFQVYQIRTAHLRHPVFRMLINDSRLLDMVESLIGPDTHVTHLRRIQRCETLGGPHQSSENFKEVGFEYRDSEAPESDYHKS
jgi:radical SAM superfamily enzyme YgiQ (UPF0313 family)